MNQSENTPSASQYLGLSSSPSQSNGRELSVITPPQHQSASMSNFSTNACCKISSKPSKAEVKPKPWVILVNAPENSLAHEALSDLLQATLHPVLKIIVMGAAAQVARVGHPLGEKYVALKQRFSCELLLCGLAAKNYGVVGDKANPNFTLTGFMEILSLLHGANEQGYRVINW